MLGAAGSGLQGWQLAVAILGFLLSVVLFAGTTWGRSFVRRLFAGQSIQQLTSTYADQMAATEAAYNVSESERRKLEEKVSDLNRVIESLRKEVADLRLIVTAREEVLKLASDEEKRHGEIMRALERLGSR